MGAQKFFKSDPQDMLTIVTCTMAVSVHFLNRIEGMSSDDWDREQMHKHTSTGRRLTRMTEACFGKLTDPVITEAAALLNDSERWGALRPAGRTWALAGVAFCIILQHLVE